MYAIQNTEDPSRWWTGKCWSKWGDRMSYPSLYDLPGAVCTVLDPVYTFDDLYSSGLCDENDDDIHYSDGENRAGSVRMDRICAWCKRVWNGIEWIEAPHPNYPVSDGMCQDCYNKKYPEDSAR